MQIKMDVTVVFKVLNSAFQSDVNGLRMGRYRGVILLRIDMQMAAGQNVIDYDWRSRMPSKPSCILSGPEQVTVESRRRRQSDGGGRMHGGPGLQAFTVMVPLEQDFEGTLRSVAAMGYQEVETIGTFGRDPGFVREVLERYGLSSPSQHLVPGRLYEVFKGFAERRLSEMDVRRLWLEGMSVDQVASIIEEGIARARVLGQRHIVWQIIWPEQMGDRNLLDGFCKAMNVAGQLCADAGMVFCFHNHAIEFNTIDGCIPYDVILQSTDPQTVKFEMDVYWAKAASADPLEYFSNHRGRFRQCHLKDFAADGGITVPGRGTIDFRTVLAAGKEAGIEHYYVEFDRSEDPMGVARDSYRYLAELM